VTQRSARASHRPGEGDVHDAEPLLIGHVDETSVATETGVVDKDVDRAELSGGGVDEVLHGCFIGDVADDRWNAEFVRRLAKASFVHIGNENPGALFQTSLCSCKSDACPSGRGYDNGLSGKQVTALGVRGNGPSCCHQRTLERLRSPGHTGRACARLVAIRCISCR